jgi:hypothetical protein
VIDVVGAKFQRKAFKVGINLNYVRRPMFCSLVDHGAPYMNKRVVTDHSGVTSMLGSNSYPRE